MTVNKFSLLAIITVSLLTSSCSNTKDGDSSGPTLADIDISSSEEDTSQTKFQKKSREEVLSAYRKYVESASTHDTSRQKALTRLAQLELELSNALLKDSKEREEQVPDLSDSVKRTIELLETTLKDYPNAKDNDKVYYQLAQAYDRAGRYEDSISTLAQLSEKYRTSLYYPEAQFRVGEAAFARTDYLAAEDAYTEVILTPGSDKFYEKALFKRGWARYKQQLYDEALDDYVDAFMYHRFDLYKNLSDSNKTQFNEYLRALGLAFSYQSEPGAIHNYFASKPNFGYQYEVYQSVGDIYLKQERFSDAATILEEYTRFNGKTKNTPIAEARIISSWQDAGFSQKAYGAIDRFYLRYNPKATFWQSIEDEETLKFVNENLREYITQVSSYFHNRYQKKRSSGDYQQALNWYERYLEHYSSYAKKDKVYTLFAELLVDGKQTERALKYFALAAYDGQIILDKKSAYTTILLTRQLMQSSKGSAKNQWLDQNLQYSQRYIELYPEDKQSASIATSAAEQAFLAKRYQNTIDLTNYVSDSAPKKVRFDGNNLKARAFLELQQFSDAEAVYLELLESDLATRKTRSTLKNSLALAIYRQGEMAQKDKDIDLALNHYIRVSRLVPDVDLASTGMYDGIALAMQTKSWNQAIGLIEEFKRRYPKHKFIGDVSKKLSVAYLNSDQKGKAAQEFERIAKFEDNQEVKMAALWQAAELYENRKDIDGAIRAYRDFAHAYKKPYEQNMEAMYKLSRLYNAKGDAQRRYFWQVRIRRADQNATKRVKTERTNFIASTTTLDLARQKKLEFDRRKLIEPIALNLKRKKTAMQDAVKLFGQASAYGVQEITTEATGAIGDIYLTFSQDLLDSERPGNLNDEELEQYEILLEDQAFPFEEKAIEFYETNLARTQDDTYDQWIEKSLKELKTLFPVRYERKGKIAAYRAQ